MALRIDARSVCVRVCKVSCSTSGRECVSSFCVDDSVALAFIVVVFDCPFRFMVQFGPISFVFVLRSISELRLRCSVRNSFRSACER